MNVNSQLVGLPFGMEKRRSKLSASSSPSSTHNEAPSSDKKPCAAVREVLGLTDRQGLLQNYKTVSGSISPVVECHCASIESTRLRLGRSLVRILTTLLAIVGLLFIISNFLFIFAKSLWNDAEDLDSIFSNWGAPGSGTESRAWYPTDFLRDVLPIPAHSHNDYWRTVPLFSAIHAGCTSVEADVWAFESDNDLYVGHDLASLTSNRTFTSLYVNPLVELLQRTNPTTPFYGPLPSWEGRRQRKKATASPPQHNGIFDRDRQQTLVLLIDVKSEGYSTWPLVMAQLQPLRERGWLSYVDGASGEVVPGPVTVVGTGNTPFDLILGNETYRDAFFDAPLDEMYEGQEQEKKKGYAGRNNATTGHYETYNTTNSFYASAHVRKALGPIWYAAGGVSDYQLHVMRGQIRGAHRRGLKVRYWSLPAWPRGFRDEVWRILVEEGVDYLNVDDLAGVRRFDRGRRWMFW